MVLLLIAAFFATCIAYVSWCDRIIGPDAAPRSGRGQRVDVSLLGSTLAILVNQAQNAFVGGVAPERLGYFACSTSSMTSRLRRSAA